MTYDALRGRIVLFGGGVARPGEPGETWEWDGSTWTLVLSAALQGTAPPNDTAGIALAFDASRGRTVMFRGDSRTGTREVWEYDGVQWANVSPPPGTVMQPSIRTEAGMVYDPTRQRVLLFGGQPGTSSSELPQEVWEWNGAAWSVATPASAGAAPGRRHAALAWDATTGRMLVFGGYQLTGSSPSYLGDLWEWRGGAWLERTPGPVPRPRIGHAMAFDELRGRVVLFGGRALAALPSVYDDTWEWDGARWRELVPSGGRPAAREGHAMAYDATARRCIVFAGSRPANLQGGLVPYADVWEWDGASWLQRTTTPAIPPRDHSAIAYDVTRRRLLMFGGKIWASNTPGIDTRELSGPVTGTWTWELLANPPPTDAIQDRIGHSLLYDGTRSLLFFGRSSYSSNPFWAMGVWQWSGAGWSSVAQAPVPAPAGRENQAMAWDSWRHRGVLFGGKAQDGTELGDVWEWTGTGWKEQVRPTDALWPQARSGVGMAFDAWRGRTVLWGGYLDPSTWEWDADLVAVPGVGQVQRRAPTVQLAVGAGSSGLPFSKLSSLRVRARGAGAWGSAGRGSQLLAWRTGGPGFGPGQWAPLGANSDGIPLAAAPAGTIDRVLTPAEAAPLFVGRDPRIVLQLRPAGSPGPAEAESKLEADYLEVRLRYRTP